MGDYVFTRLGRIGSLIALSGFWWMAAGLLTSLGYGSWLVLAGALAVPAVAGQVRRYGRASRTAAAMTVHGGVSAVAGWMCGQYPHMWAAPALAVPCLAAFILVMRTLPPVCVVSPELRPWLTPDDIARAKDVWDRTGRAIDQIEASKPEMARR